MRTFQAVFASCAFLAAAAYGAYCHGKPAADAPSNPNPINTDAPKFVRKNDHGAVYEAGRPGYEFHVIHLYGTAYERGLAHGQLMKEEANGLVDGVWQYMEEQLIDGAGLQKLPQWLQDLIAEVGLDIALDVTFDWTKNFTGAYIYDEMQGLADGANISFTKLRDIHLIGSLTQGDCSMFGAWGSATADGKTIQLRALDWDTSNPFRQHPAILVEHPTDEGHAYASVGFVGWLGALTGMSSKQVAISEIGIAFPDSTFGNESRVGIPFTFLLRDILQFDDTIDDSIRRIQDAHRTCDLILGVGDGKAPHGPGAGSESHRGDGSDLPVVGPVTSIEYSYSVANFQNPKNNAPFNQTWHPYIPDVVKQFMDWNCPGFQETGSHQLQKFHGSITPENTISDIVARTQTGSTHVAVYDLTDNEMYVSFLERVNATVQPHDLYAYEREYTKFNMTELFAVEL